MEPRKKKSRFPWMLTGSLAILCVVGIVIGVKQGTFSSWLSALQQQNVHSQGATTPPTVLTDAEGNPIASAEPQATDDPSDTSQGGQKADVLLQAERLAQSYDYDAAMELLKASDLDSERLSEVLQSYEAEKGKLVAWEKNSEIPHIFFHSLIVDTKKAFDGDRMQDGYNNFMTTIKEFNSIIEQMYNNGFVLVSMHDIATLQKQADGKTKMVQEPIMLPPGKKPFVLSQDDVNYYEYMEGDGFAARLVIDKDGKVVNEYVQDDGSVITGSFDVLPLLEDFIAEHPDFSYRGARGILAITGYNGVLGFRTSPSQYPDSPTLAADTVQAREVATAIRELGWEFSSHSWSHRDMAKISYKDFVADAERWEKEVESIIGEVDIYLYPFGSDIGSWKPYAGERYEFLKSKGFRYFCNVDSAPFWVQIGDEYVRQGRRNLDGIRLYEAMYKGRDRVSDLFNVKEVFDDARPLPVPG